MGISGTITALITPFRDGSVDVEGLKHNIYFQLEEGVDGLLILGSTGEMLTQDSDERATVMQTVIHEVQGRVPVYINTGAASTKEAIAQTRQAKKLGATGALIAPPYYVRPTEEGVYKHFCAVADEAGLPLVLYNVPKRTGIDMNLGVLADLSNHPNIIGIKESSGDLTFFARLVHQSKNKDFDVLSGEDIVTLPALSLGGTGAISVASNVVPAKMRKLVRAAIDGQLLEARDYHSELMPLFMSLLSEPNPIAIKYAMKLCGMAAGDARAPLLSIRQEHGDRVKQALELLTSA